VIKKFYALPFLNPNQTLVQQNVDPQAPADLDFCFGEVCTELRDLNLPEAPLKLVEEFITYYRQQWMERHRLTFNLFGVDDHRTNNDLEGWHIRMSHLIHRKENLWRFITAVKKEQQSKEVEFVQIEHGVDIMPQRARQREKEARFSNMKVSYIAGRLAPMAYLNNLSIFMGH
jgi:hypothetical protein